MNQILSAIKEFYENNRDLAHILIGALAGSIFMLLVKSIGHILGAIRTVLVFVGKQIGGTLAYKSFLDSYLNWMVVEYQELNLTGIIGSGPKPKLEQVFISLSLSRETEPPLEEPRTGLVKVWDRISGVLRRKKEELEERPSKVIKRAPETITFYQRRRAYKGFFERNEGLFDTLQLAFTVALIIGFFACLPAYVLFWNTTSNVWVISLAGLISGLALVLLVLLLCEALKERDTSFRNFLIRFVGSLLAVYILTGMLLIHQRGMSPNKAAFALAGASVSIIRLYRK